MKIALITATLLTLWAATASAVEFKTPVTRQLYTCANGGLSRVSTGTTPVPCCEGMLGCPQLLSNTGFDRPRRANRT